MISIGSTLLAAQTRNINAPYVLVTLEKDRLYTSGISWKNINIGTSILTTTTKLFQGNSFRQETVVDSVQTNGGWHFWGRLKSNTLGACVPALVSSYRFAGASFLVDFDTLDFGATYNYDIGSSTLQGLSYYNHGSAMYKGQSQVFLYRTQLSGQTFSVLVHTVSLSGSTPSNPSTVLSAFVPGASGAFTTYPVTTLSRVGNYLYVSAQRGGTVGLYRSYINPSSGQYGVLDPIPMLGMSASQYVTHACFVTGDTNNPQIVAYLQKQLNPQASNAAYQYDNYQTSIMRARLSNTGYALEPETVWKSQTTKFAKGIRALNVSRYHNDDDEYSFVYPYVLNQYPSENLTGGSAPLMTYMEHALTISQEDIKFEVQATLRGRANILGDNYVPLMTLRGTSHYFEVIGQGWDSLDINENSYFNHSESLTVDVIRYANSNNNTINLTISNTDVT